MGEAIPKQTVVIAAMVVLFLAFMGIRLVMDAGRDATVATQVYYDELTAALLDAGVLPTGSPETIILKAAKATPPDTGFGEHQDVGTGGYQIVLGPALTLRIMNNQPTELKVTITEWNRISNPRLRQAMRELSRLDVDQQRQGASMMPMGNNAPSSANFYFTGEAESVTYELIPHFNGQECVTVRIRRK